MADFPANLFYGVDTVISSVGAAADICAPSGQNGSSAALWPAANRAIYVPVQIERPVTIVQMATLNGAGVLGNVDVGIYSINGTRLVSNGAVAVSGISQPQIFDITDTALNPGVYFLAMMCTDAAVATFQRAAPGTQVLQSFGVQQQAVAEGPLPATAAFANPASNYLPAIFAATRTVL